MSSDYSNFSDSSDLDREVDLGSLDLDDIAGGLDDTDLDLGDLGDDDDEDKDEDY